MRGHWLLLLCVPLLFFRMLTPHARSQVKGHFCMLSMMHFMKGGSCYGTALHVMYKQGIWSPKALCYMCMQGIMTMSKRMCIDPSCWVHDNKALAANIFSNSQSVASVGSCISHITCMQSVPYHIMPNVIFSFCKRTACRSSLGSLM